MSFGNPFYSGFVPHHLWLDDAGSVGIGTDAFSYVPAAGVSEKLSNAYLTNLPTRVTASSSIAPYTAKLAVLGSIYCTGLQVASDKRLKDEIVRLDSSKSLEAIMNLSPVLFSWKDSGKITSGFFAQEVESIIPEAVFSINHPDFEDGQRTVEMWPFIAHLTNAIQEQQHMIDEKDEKIKNLENKLSKIEKLLEKHNIS